MERAKPTFLEGGEGTQSRTNRENITFFKEKRSRCDHVWEKYIILGFCGGHGPLAPLDPPVGGGVIIETRKIKDVVCLSASIPAEA